MKDATRILTRYENNPILHVQDFPGAAQLYNPSPVMYRDETVLLVSVVEHSATEGHGRDVGQTRVARSRDGVNFTLGTENFIRVPENMHCAELYHHYIDNRVTKIDDTYYIVTPVMVHGFDSPVGLLGKTYDFVDYEPIESSWLTFEQEK